MCLQDCPRRRGAVPDGELVPARVDHPDVHARRPVGDAEHERDVVAVGDDGHDYDGAGIVGRVVQDHLAVPSPAAPQQAGPVLEDILDARADVRAQGEVAGGRVLGASPRNQLALREACPVVHPDGHAGEDGVGRVIEALPQGCAFG